MSNLNRYKLTAKKLSKAKRYITGDIKVAPTFMNRIGHDHFKVVDDTLYHEGKEVVSEDDALNKIIEMDADVSKSGGRDRLYYHLSQKYIGISKSMVANYLQNSSVNQLNAPIPRRVQNKPIVISNKALVWQIDLVDMSTYAAANNGMKWIFTAIDLFSKLASAEPMKTKSQPNVLAAYDAIMESIPKSWRPRVVQCDNGSEFQTQFADHLKTKYNQKVIHSQAYNPTSQGCVERFNKTLKTSIFKSFTKYNSQRWVDQLKLIITGYNTSPQSTTKQVPLDVMKGKVDRAEVHDRIKTAAAKRTQDVTSDHSEFKLGDSVRVLLNSDARARKDLKFAKRIGQNWSNDIYQVRSVSQPTEVYNRPTYLLRLGSRDLKKKYHGYQLQYVDLNKLIDTQVELKDRPVFDKSMFDGEKHISQLSKRPTIPATAKIPEKTNLQERKSRVRKANTKYDKDFVK